MARKLSKIEKKTKILMYADAPTCCTGFSTVARNIAAALYKTGKYEIDIFGINYHGDPYDQKKLPYRIWPAITNAQHDPYGRQKFVQMAQQMEFDILFFLQDTFILDFIPPLIGKLKESGKKFKSICYYPIDGRPKAQWINNVNPVDYLVTYTEYAKNLSKEVFPMVQDTKVIYHGANVSEYYPVAKEQAQQFKERYLGEKNKDKFIVTNLNRNQQRKDIPRTIAAFKEFKKEVPNSLLYLHMAKKDQGWDLEAVVQAFGLEVTKDVMFPENFNVNQGYPINFVNMIYNMSDLIVSTTTGEGFGLCLHPDTNVYTESGIKFMKDLNIQDKVLSSDGTYNDVEAIMSKDHDGDLYNITTWLSNIPIKSSPEHGFLVLGEEDYVWKKACELSVGDELLFPREFDEQCVDTIDIFEFIKPLLNIRQLSNINNLDDSFRIQSNFKKEEKYIPKEIKITKSLMYLFGLYLAEGSISSSKKDSIYFSFHKDETDLIDFVKLEMKKVFDLNGTMMDTSSRNNYNGATVCFYSSVVCNLFYKLFGSGARDKRIHSIISNQPKERLLKFVYGEFMGDGSYSDKTYEFTFSTTSKHIAYGLRKILAKLGVLSSVRTSRVEYKVNVSGISKEKLLILFEMTPPILDRRFSKEKCKMNESYLIMPIKSIEVSQYSGKLVDIQVANTNDFVAENVIVHNSWIEGMATQTPILMPNNTAMTEFISEDRGYLSKSMSTSSQFIIMPNDNDVIRPLVDVDDMVKQMLSIYNDYPEAERRAKNAYDWVHTKMDWQGTIGRQWVSLFNEAVQALKAPEAEVISDAGESIIETESF